MNKHFITLFAQSPVHVGAGNSVGAVDSPVMRERHTRIPVIPGSALKGVISDLWQGKRADNSDAVLLFGSEDAKSASAGQLLIGEARVLAFPLRSAKKSFAWITCPLTLERFRRDSGRDFEIPALSNEEHCWAPDDLKLNDQIVLEEYTFMVKNNTAKLAAALKDITDDKLWKTLAERLVLVTDEIFSFFVENACEIVARIGIDDEKGTVKAGALFNQEQVPSETLFYFPVAAENKKDMDAETALSRLKEKLAENGNMIQVGGDETIGLGFCEVKFM